MGRNQYTGQSRFTRRLSDAQRDAILRSVLVAGNSVAETIRMANTGQLDVPAFELGRYAYDIISDGREAFESRDPDALAVAVERELRGAEADALAHIRAIRRGFKRDGTSDPATLANATKALSAIKRARREASAGQKPANKAKSAVNTPNGDSVNAGETASTLASLLEAAAKGARGPVRSASR